MVVAISRLELQRWIDSGERFALVEPLPAEAFALGHLPGAVNVPHESLAAWAAEHLPDKASRVVVYCANVECNASSNAAALLEQLGYTGVREFHGGKREWQMAGNLLER